MDGSVRNSGIGYIGGTCLGIGNKSERRKDAFEHGRSMADEPGRRS